MVVGEKVQTELAGRPEQAKVSVPLTVLVGVMKSVRSVVAPWATATSMVLEIRTLLLVLASTT